MKKPKPQYIKDIEQNEEVRDAYTLLCAMHLELGLNDVVAQLTDSDGNVHKVKVTFEKIKE